MKKILFLLLLITSVSYGQAIAPTRLKITNNAISTTAPFVNVQETDGFVNKINKSDLIEVLEYASAINLPVTGVAGKIYVTLDNNRLYRWTGAIYQELTTDISSKENISNKQNSLAADGTNTKYPTVTAVNAGLANKVTSTGTTGNIQRIVGTNQLGNSALTDNGTSVTCLLPLSVSGPIGGNVFVKSGATATNILLAGGGDVAQASLPVSTATQTALNLKANLASPTFTGAPLVPTASNGTNTLQAASTAFVNGAIGNGTALSAGSLTLSSTVANSDFKIPFVSAGPFLANVYANAGISINPSTNLLKLGGSMQITGTTTATSFINSTAPAANALLANGTTLANPISGSGTIGYLPKFTSAGVLGNSLVFDNGVNVGIGTTTPMYRFQVKQGTNQNIQFRNSDYGSVGGMLLQASNDADNASIPFEFGASKFSFNIGNVGINTINPTEKLEVVGNVLATQYKLSALNTAPTSATATGTLGEIRITAGFIYICIATNTWVRAALTTWI